MSDTVTGPGDSAETNPVRGSNKLKLGLFATNGAGGASMTLHPDGPDLDWDQNIPIAKLADAVGLEVIVSFARWKPFGGDGNRSGRILDPIAWGAAVAAITRRISVMSTVHVSAFNPVTVAKAGATIDRISHGRFALNIVCGWFPSEMALFGAEQKEHGDRYDVADEWLEVIEKLWTEEKSFDYAGRYYDLKGAVSDPRPIQRRPIIMNASGSPRGREFAAQHSDMAFILPHDPSPEALRAQVDEYRKLARDRFGRDLQLWSYCYIVQRDSIAEAQAYVDEYAGEHGDVAAADAFIANNIAGAKTAPPEVWARMRKPMMAGAGGVPVLGTPRDIADTLKMLSDVGIDGVLLTWLDYEKGLRQFAADVLPLIEQDGLRAPAAPLSSDT